MGYSHGRKWTEEMIEEKICDVQNGLSINHFPTHSEMNNFIGNKSLSQAISKHGGTEYWSNKMCIPIKKSETEFGEKYESYAINDIFEHTGLLSIHTNSHHAYDILTNECVKIDVKASMENILKSNDTHYYSFNLEKKQPTCDIFILYCVNPDLSIYKTIIIPSALISGKTQIGIGKNNSKWDSYRNQWRYIVEFNDFFQRYKEK